MYGDFDVKLKDKGQFLGGDCLIHGRMFAGNVKNKMRVAIIRFYFSFSPSF